MTWNTPMKDLLVRLGLNLPTAFSYQNQVATILVILQLLEGLTSIDDRHRHLGLDTRALRESPNVRR